MMLGLRIVSLAFVVHIMTQEKAKSSMATKVSDTSTSEAVPRKEFRAQANPVIIAANEMQSVTKKDNTDAILERLV